VDLTVPAGSFFAILGSSGCGKTTLLRLVAGFERLDGGTITLAGRLVSSRARFVPPERRRVGIVPQEGALFPHLSVARNVAFGLDRSARRTNRVDEVLELVGLAGYRNRMPHELSGGQQQRVAVARALAPKPASLLLDEPFNALDAGLRGTVRADLAAAIRAEGATAVLVTHDQDEALSTADLVAVMRDGTVVQAGEPARLYREPSDEWVGRFLGEANVFAAPVAGGFATTPLGTVPVSNPTDGAGKLLLRPEQLIVDPRATHTATVIERQYFGHDIMLALRCGAVDTRTEPLTLHARVPPSDDRPVGSLIGVRVAGSARLLPDA